MTPFTGLKRSSFCLEDAISNKPMLHRFSKAARLRAAVLMAVIYALCVLAPTVAVASTGVACPNETAGIMQVHKHAGQLADQDHAKAHADQGKSSQHNNTADEGKCCGAMFFSAIAPGHELSLAPLTLTARLITGANASVVGRAPDRLIRPPALLS